MTEGWLRNILIFEWGITKDEKNKNNSSSEYFRDK
jgi:hypothetical protein